MKVVSNKALIIITLISYLLIIISNEKMDMPVFTIILAGIWTAIWGVGDIDTIKSFLFLFALILSIVYVIYIAISKQSNSIYRKIFLLASLAYFIAPLYVWHSNNPIMLTYHRSVFLFIPELVFIISYLLLLTRILNRKSIL